MFRKFLSALISFVVLFSLFSVNTSADEAGCKTFVTDLYASALGRDPDPNGLESWASVLGSHRTTGVAVAYGFIFSEEFKGRGLDDTAYVEVLYKSLLGRDADDIGKAEWVSHLASGTSRETLFGSFVNSPEFFWRCNNSGITGGTYIEGRDLTQVSKANLFIDRLYTIALGRSADQDGMNNWTSAVLNGSATGASTAYGFFFSQEYKDRHRNGDGFVRDLYRVILDREPGDTEVQPWADLLGRGYSREFIFSQFTNSQEFCAICSECGITAGTHIPGANEDSVTKTSLFVNRLYKIVLGRDADSAGMNNWAKALIEGTETGASTALGFFFSPEYLGQGKDNSGFLNDLYRVMLDRKPDSAGLESWLERLEIGYSRKLIIAGFVNSPEFTSICDSYGIRRGDYSINGWSYDGDNRIFIRDGARLYGWAQIDGAYYYFDRKTGILATNTRVNQIAVDGDGRAEDTEFARQKIPVMIKAREIYLSITNPGMSVYEKQMACCKYIMPFPYLMKDYTVGKHANNWACLTAHYANNILNAYGDQPVRGGECYAEACALAYLFNEIDEGQVYVDRDEMHGWVEMNGMFWDPLFAESKGLHYLNMEPKNYEYTVAPFQEAL